MEMNKISSDEYIKMCTEITETIINDRPSSVLDIIESYLMPSIGSKELGEKLSDIINQDSSEKTDGQCLDDIIALLVQYNLYKKRI